MFYSDGKLRSHTDAQRREYGERKRAERSREWNKIWITKHTLKNERNWTDWAIKTFLKKPRKMKGRYRIYYVYKREDVIKAEKEISFKEWMATRIERQSKLAE